MLTKEQKRYIREFAEDLVDVWKVNLGEEGFAEEIEIDVGSDAYEGLSREDIRKIKNYIEISKLKNSENEKKYIIHLTSTEYKYIRDIIATQEIELDSLVDKNINPHAKTIKSIAKHFLE